MKTVRLYYDDCYLRAFSGRVVSAREIAGKPALALDRTAFYPTSGGQPHDSGVLGGAPVLDVIDEGDTIWHVLGGDLGDVIDGKSTVSGEIDWDRRFNHMQQHTGQHILSACMERRCQASTVSFHMGEESSTIDVSWAPLSDEDVVAAERLANEIVLEDRPVSIHTVSPDDLERFALRKPATRTGQVRVIEVANFDYSACGGTHCGRTGSVGPIKVLRWERRGADSRVEFVCGWRALQDYWWKHESVKVLAERLSVKDRGLVEAVERQSAALADSRDQLALARDQLLGYEVTTLLGGAERLTLTGRSASLVSTWLADRGAEELKRMAQRLTSERSVVALLGGKQSGRIYLVFGQTPGLPFDCASLLREAATRLGGRGGGTRDLAQGGSADSSDLEATLKLAAERIRGEAGSG